MDEIGHTVGKLISRIFTGFTILFFFGITGWLILIIFGYAYLQSLQSGCQPEEPQRDIQVVHPVTQPTVYQNQTIDGKILPFRRIIK